MMDTQQQKTKAIQAIERHERETARRLLVTVLHANPDDTEAWLWMSDLVDTDKQRRYCLRRVLEREPQNATAIARLTELQSQRSLADVDIDPTTPKTKPGTSKEMTDENDALDDAQRKRGHRRVMAAGAMMLILVIGLVLLVVITTTIVPRTRERFVPTPEPVLYVATLWCLPCAQSGNPIVLWEKVGNGQSRGAKVGQLPHDTPVSVLDEQWSEPEARTYIQVAANGQRGWVPDTFIRK